MLPDGKTVAFTREKSPQSALFVVALTGGEPTRLTEWGELIGRLDWTPGGQEILYPQLDTAACGSFESLPPRGRRRYPSPACRLASTCYRCRGRGPDRLTVWCSGTGQPDIGLRLIDLESAAQTGLFATVTPFCDSTRIDMPGRFSRDGRQLAFESDRNGDAQIWVAWDGSDLRSVTAPQTTFVNAGSWSPDGRSVAVEGIAGGSSHIYVVSAEGGPPIRSTSGPAVDNDPEWSRDGAWVYYGSSASGRSEIWKIPAAGNARASDDPWRLRAPGVV